MSATLHSTDVSARLRRLILFRSLLEDKAVQAFSRFTEAIMTSKDPSPAARDRLAAFTSRLAQLDEVYPGEPLPDVWQNHVVNRILFSENAWAARIDAPGPDLVPMVARELDILQDLFAMDAQWVTSRIGSDPWDGWGALRPPRNGDQAVPEGGLATEMRRRFVQASRWSELVDPLADYYREAGVGLMGRFAAFRWDAAKHSLKGISEPDPVRLEHLVGYEVERNIVVRNTAKFVQGYPANNILLYGDRGTGKSATVKACLHRFARQGLRMIELPKRNLQDLPAILSFLRKRRGRFLLFVDDLSFEEHETAYKDLKAILEGTLESRPENTLVYVTTNRRHLVRERLTDRGEIGHDPRHRDTLEEKLSVSDRFGVTVVFSTPEQEAYLRIVEAIADRRDLAIDRAELRRRALKWAMWQNGRSARTAHQFIDDLQGELALD